jgi:hypothetical protein
MKNQNATQIAAATSSRKLTATGKDGKWKSFHLHAGLMQYLQSGVFFARAKVNGMVRRSSIETDVFSTAKLAKTCTCTLWPSVVQSNGRAKCWF